MSFNTKQSKAPAKATTTWSVYQVIESGSEDKPNRWVRFGVFFGHPDGEGGNLILDGLPFDFDGRLVLRAPKGDDAK